MTPARLLDLTRTLRRVGRGVTGVDRVERAYLRRFLADDVSVYGLMRTRFGYVVLDRAGLNAFQDRLMGRQPWGSPDLLARLPKPREGLAQAAESDVRRMAVARTIPALLAWRLAKLLPAGFAYFNVGHSNLTDRMFDAVSRAKGQAHVLVHDVIPLEYPQFQRAGTIAPFEGKMRRVAARADRVIYNSHDTKLRTERLMQQWGSVPPSVVAHLGVEVFQSQDTDLREGVDVSKPYFICVGTIEPRKNHAFLLDLWEEMGPNAPRLYICGARGWNNEEVFARLDALPADHPVQELTDLSDKELGALMKSTNGLLMPSLAEGFGLPPIEAAMLGMRVLSNNLEVIAEILGDIPIYASVLDRYLWIKAIREWELKPPRAGKIGNFTGPTWIDHFNMVLKLK